MQGIQQELANHRHGLHCQLGLNMADIGEERAPMTGAGLVSESVDAAA